MTDACGNKALTPILDAVAAAEEIADPLDGLVKRVADNPGVPFIPDVLARLCELRREDLPAFEGLRARLKKAGCRVTALDAAMAEESGDGGGRRPRQADILIGLAAEADCFHTADGTGYVDLDIKGHRETSPIRSKGFKRWIARRFYELTDGAPNSEALQAALNVIEARAHFDAPQMDVHIRVAGHDGTLYIDLADDAWRAVEIDEGGWRVVENPPVRFRRATGMQPLPTPAAGGFVEILRPFLNVGDDDFVLVVAWALAVLRNRGPYPVIVLSGEQGSAKSTVSAILRSLLDPNSAPLRALPREDRDLFIAAKNSHVLAFDNVSGLQPWISDTLCRLSTGGGFAVRQLYTDQDEVLFDAVRPVILNGIEDIAARPDLADRAIFLTLESIPEERRRPEAELWAAFETERPRILGVLIEAVVQELRMLPDTKLKRLPPLGEFCPMGISLRGRDLAPGTFWSAYCGNRDEAIENVIEADPVAAVVRALMETRTKWTGTATALLGTLSDRAGEPITKSKTWPASPRALSGRLRRAATFLRKVGIDIDHSKEGRARTRVIHMTTARGNSGAPDYRGAQPSAPSAQPPKGNGPNAFAENNRRTVGDVADGQGGDVGPDTASTVRANPLKSADTDDADAKDANLPSQTGPKKNGRQGWGATR